MNKSVVLLLAMLASVSSFGQGKTQLATFGGGCFWCVEAVFQELIGVEKAESGYAGGEVKNPTYEAVCSGRTGHAEVVQITFDPAKISYEELVEIYLVTHDPTTLNRQGADVGTQYRSIILYHDEEQKATAERVIKDFGSTIWENQIVTEVSAYGDYYAAEKYHQDFYANNPEYGYCTVVINPKVAKFRKKYAAKLRKEGIAQ